MTRDKAINILASLAGGATQPSWEEIRKAAQFAFDVLSASSEDGVHIQFNDERTFKREQPQGLDEARQLSPNLVPTCSELSPSLDEAAEEYAWEKEEPLADGERLSVCFNPRIDAFKAGAKWMAEQFQKIEGELVDWYSTSDGKDYCCGVKTIDSFEVPEGFYIRKKQ